MKKTDRQFVLHIRDEINLLSELSQTLTYEKLLTDKFTQHCIQKSLEIIGEAAKNISEETKAQCPQIPWHELTGMRDKLTHDYFGINWEIVWGVLEHDIPQLTLCIEKLLQVTENPGD
ncbi:MAG TPA: DUF86 domain-containing protein [Methanocorpusculum sp.]|nr:DUF86 domain-containing protein [Methanocorpusculum sp.]